MIVATLQEHGQNGSLDGVNRRGKRRDDRKGERSADEAREPYLKLWSETLLEGRPPRVSGARATARALLGGSARER